MTFQKPPTLGECHTLAVCELGDLITWLSYDVVHCYCGVSVTINSWIAKFSFGDNDIKEKLLSRKCRDEARYSLRDGESSRQKSRLRKNLYLLIFNVTLQHF